MTSKVFGEPVLQLQLDRARQYLQYTQRELHAARRGALLLRGEDALELSVKDFYKALDRVWELQCMVHGVFTRQPHDGEQHD